MFISSHHQISPPKKAALHPGLPHFGHFLATLEPLLRAHGDKARCIRWEVSTCELGQEISENWTSRFRENGSNSQFMNLDSLRYENLGRFCELEIWICSVEAIIPNSMHNHVYIYIILSWELSHCSISSATLYFFPYAVIHQVSSWSRCNILIF